MQNIMLLTKPLGVATIILNKPEKHNAFNDELINNLLAALEQIAKDETVRIVVLKAYGKNFCAGADLNWMQRMANYTEEQNIHDSLQLAKLMHAFYFCPKPTLALVQGATYGGGIGLIACCDMAIAAEDASFCFSEVKIGLIPAVISPYIIQSMGARAARRYFFTAETFNALIAQQLGLIHEITAKEALETIGQQWIDKILQNSPQALAATKKLILEVETHPLNEELMKKTAKEIAAIRTSTEGQAGLKAFLNKQNMPWNM